MIALVKDVPLREADDDLSIDVPYLAEVCSQRLGPLPRHHDEPARSCLRRLGDYGLSGEEQARVYERLTPPSGGHRGASSKSLRWQLRAAVGERVAWRREVEDTEGTPVVAPEWDWRRDLG